MKTKFIHWGILLFVTSVLLFIFYGDILTSPNHHLFNGEGDGVKNYYSFLYHIKHDSSYTWFEGMNYPYGDLHLYTDGNHPFSNFLKTFSGFPGIEGYEVGWFNLYILLSVFPAVFLLYATLKAFNVETWLALIGAITIGMFSPQWYRLGGHYSLAISYVIPLSLYLTSHMILHKGNKLYLMFAGIFFFTLFIFSHPYLGLMACGIMLGSAFIHILYTKKERFNLFLWLPLLATSLLPIIIFQLYTTVYDPIVDRPQNPFGVNAFNSNMHSVFLPQTGPLRIWTNDHFDYSLQIWEGASYIGITTIIMLLLFGLTIPLTFSEKLSSYLPRLSPLLYVWVILGFLFLLFSFGYLHQLMGPQYEHLLGPIRQFRGLGRFSWIFYYITTIFTFCLLNGLIKKYSNVFTYIATVLLIIGYGIEWWPMQQQLSNQLTVSTNKFTKEGETTSYASLHEIAKKIDTMAYQAILPLPYYHLGAEYITMDPKGEIMPYSQVLSYVTGLPIMASSMSRTSLSQSKIQFRQMQPPYVASKPQGYALKDKKILVLTHKSIPLRSWETWILERGNLLMENDYFELHTITPDQLIAYNERLPSLKTTSDSSVIKENFSTSDYNEHTFSDGGAFFGNPKTEYISFYTVPSGKLSPGNYEASVWVYNAFPEKKTFYLVQEKTSDEKYYGWTNLADMSASPFIYDDWTMVKLDFTVEEAGSELTFIVSNDVKYPVILDNLLIRAKDQGVIQPWNETLQLFNNRPIQSKAHE